MKPEEQKKVTILVGAIVLVFGAGGFNILRMASGGGAPAAAPTPSPAPLPTPSTTALIGDSALPNSPEASPNPAVKEAFLPQNTEALPPNAANPFREIVTAPSTTAGTASAAPPTAGKPAATQSAPPQSSSNRSYIEPPMARMRVAPEPPMQRTVAPVVPQPAPSISNRKQAATASIKEYLAAIPLELVGVVENSDGSSCALIKNGDQQVLVGLGERVSEFRVEKIEIDSVTLSNTRLKRTLRVGADGTTNNSVSAPKSNEISLAAPVDPVNEVKRNDLFSQSSTPTCSVPPMEVVLKPFEGDAKP